MNDDDGHDHVTPIGRYTAETLVPCPLCHADGAGMVTAEKRREWVNKYPELGSQPPPPKGAA